MSAPRIGPFADPMRGFPSSEESLSHILYADGIQSIEGIPRIIPPTPRAGAFPAVGLYLPYRLQQTGWAGSSLFRPIYVIADHLATDATPTQNVSQGIYSQVNYGDGTTAGKGTSHCFSSAFIITNSGDPGNEYCNSFAYQRNDSPATPGRNWLTDWGVYGAVGVQQQILTGVNLVIGNYFNGSPSSAESYGIGVLTRTRIGPSIGSTVPHWNADNFPVDNAIQVLGSSGSAASPATGPGFKRGLKLGRSGSGWGIAASWFQTGIEINDFDTAGLAIQNRRPEAAATIPAILIPAGNGGIVVGDTAVGDSDTLLYLRGTASSLSDPLADFVVPGATDSLAVRFLNGSGSGKIFVTGAANGFLNGTAAGDWGLKANSATKTVHIGGTTKILSVTGDDKFGAFGATPIVRPTVTGSRGGNAALASFLTQMAALGWITDSTTA